MLFFALVPQTSDFENMSMGNIWILRIYLEHFLPPPNREEMDVSLVSEALKQLAAKEETSRHLRQVLLLALVVEWKDSDQVRALKEAAEFIIRFGPTGDLRQSLLSPTAPQTISTGSSCCYLSTAAVASSMKQHGGVEILCEPGGEDAGDWSRDWLRPTCLFAAVELFYKCRASPCFNEMVENYDAREAAVSRELDLLCCNMANGPGGVEHMGHVEDEDGGAMMTRLLPQIQLCQLFASGRAGSEQAWEEWLNRMGRRLTVLDALLQVTGSNPSRDDPLRKLGEDAERDGQLMKVGAETMVAPADLLYLLHLRCVMRLELMSPHTAEPNKAGKLLWAFEESVADLSDVVQQERQAKNKQRRDIGGGATEADLMEEGKIEKTDMVLKSLMAEARADLLSELQCQLASRPEYAELIHKAANKMWDIIVEQVPTTKQLQRKCLEAVCHYLSGPAQGKEEIVEGSVEKTKLMLRGLLEMLYCAPVVSVRMSSHEMRQVEPDGAWTMADKEMIERVLLNIGTVEAPHRMTCRQQVHWLAQVVLDFLCHTLPDWQRRLPDDHWERHAHRGITQLLQLVVDKSEQWTDWVGDGSKEEMFVLRDDITPE
eukprot:GHVS01051210.1.p1 GENE.GHVS01051210.1~~GHVS01051210.1.p1  ORF type:complete len:601 (+),score=123.91 GHVS01051210.1:836-2638(+)